MIYLRKIKVRNESFFTVGIAKETSAEFMKRKGLRFYKEEELKTLSKESKLKLSIR